MCDVDYEPCEVWRETARLARKPHRCGGCHARIRVGEAYLSHFSKFDGKVLADELCFACWLAREEFIQAHHVGPVPSGLRDALTECVAEAPADPSTARWRRLLAELRHRGQAEGRAS